MLAHKAAMTSLKVSFDAASEAAAAQARREAQARRAQLAPGTEVGVTEEMIAALVEAFYAQVRDDATLGPIFEGHVADWDQHLAKLRDFWSSVTLMTGRFKGAPMAAHARLPGVAGGEFARWLAIWEHTARAVCPPAAADLFVAKARMIAESLQLGLAVQRGEFLPTRSTGAA